MRRDTTEKSWRKKRLTTKTKNMKNSNDYATLATCHWCLHFLTFIGVRQLQSELGPLKARILLLARPPPTLQNPSAQKVPCVQLLAEVSMVSEAVFKVAKTTANLVAISITWPSKAEEAKKHKLKRLVQGPNSYFMDVKCPGCYNIQTVFSHVHATVFCSSCSILIAQPTGGKSKLTEGCSFRKKYD